MSIFACNLVKQHGIYTNLALLKLWFAFLFYIHYIHTACHAYSLTALEAPWEVKILLRTQLFDLGYRLFSKIPVSQPLIAYRWLYALLLRVACKMGLFLFALLFFFDLIISSICIFFLRYWVLWLQVFNPRMTVTHHHLLKLLDSLLSKNLNYQKYEFISWKYWFEIWQKQPLEPQNMLLRDWIDCCCHCGDWGGLCQSCHHHFYYNLF